MKKAVVTPRREGWWRGVLFTLVDCLIVYEARNSAERMLCSRCDLTSGASDGHWGDMGCDGEKGNVTIHVETRRSGNGMVTTCVNVSHRYRRVMSTRTLSLWSLM